MTAHEEFQSDIPAYVSRRLETDTLRRLEAHLGQCEECRDLVAGLTGIAGTLREAGAAMFDPHPDPEELRTHATAGRAAGADRLSRHLATCPTCALEASVLARTRSGAADARPATAEPARSGWFRRTLSPALAAGAVLGFGLAVLMARSGANWLVSRPAAPVWRGPVDLRVLPGPTRGEGPVLRIRVARSQPYVVLPIALGVPDGLSEDERFGIEIADEGGRVVYSLLQSRSALAKHLDPSGVWSLALPATDLPPGRYEAVFYRAVAEREILFVNDFEIAVEGEAE